MKWIFRIFGLFIFLATSLGAFYLIVITIDDDLEFGDTFALFGGEEERGYLSAGYLISYEDASSFKTCGFSALSNNIGITAGHCVDNSSRIEIGRGFFNLNSAANVNVIRGVQKEGWVTNKERVNDFAILIYNAPPGYFGDFAEIGSPSFGCDYRVVAYGRTENDVGSSLERPRKSAAMCITEIRDNIFFMTAQDEAGICFGDSGSPVYVENTNIVVGVTASIVNNSRVTTGSPCDFNNVAIAVRADLNQNLVNENEEVALNEILVNEEEVALTDFDIAVAQESVWDQIGLSTISDDEASLIITYTGAAVGSLLVIALLYFYSNRREIVKRRG